MPVDVELDVLVVVPVEVDETDEPDVGCREPVVAPVPLPVPESNASGGSAGSVVHATKATRSEAKLELEDRGDIGPSLRGSGWFLPKHGETTERQVGQGGAGGADRSRSWRRARWASSATTA